MDRQLTNSFFRILTLSSTLTTPRENFLHPRELTGTNSVVDSEAGGRPSVQRAAACPAASLVASAPSTSWSGKFLSTATVLAGRATMSPTLLWSRSGRFESGPPQFESGSNPFSTETEGPSQLGLSHFKAQIRLAAQLVSSICGRPVFELRVLLFFLFLFPLTMF